MALTQHRRDLGRARFSTTLASESASVGGVAGLDEPELWRLRMEVALDVIPLVSRFVVSHADRALVVADVVDQWLALPPEARQRYTDAAGGQGTGLECFGWAFVDRIEQAGLGDDHGPKTGCGWVASPAEQCATECWGAYLESRRVTQGLPDSECAVRDASALATCGAAVGRDEAVGQGDRRSVS